MVLVSAALFLVASVLPSAMGLTLDTPATSESNGAIAVTWKTQAGDPKFTIILSNQDFPEDIDVQTGVDPTTLKQTVNLGTITPGNYELKAVNANDIEVPLSTSGAFKIVAAGTLNNAGAGAGAGAGDNSAAGGAAAGSAAASASDAEATCPPPVTVTVTAAAGAATGAASAAATGAASAAAAGAAGAAAGGAAANAGAAAAATASKAKGKAAKNFGKGNKSPFGKNVGRSIFSAKFGRRELYRD